MAAAGSIMTEGSAARQFAFPPELSLEGHGSILVAEDCADTRMLLSYILERAGHEVCFAADGVEALESALFARATGDPFDLIILDLKLPRMDGHTAARVLRGKGFKVPIIAMTSSRLPFEEEESIAAGCSFHMTKNHMGRDLLPLIEHALMGAPMDPYLVQR